MQELAKRLNVSYQALYASASGNPTIGKLSEIAKALGVNVSDLLYSGDPDVNFIPTEESQKYRCRFVPSSDVENMRWNTSYEHYLQVAPSVGDILDFSSFLGEFDYIIEDFGTKYFTVDKRIIYPLGSNEKADFDFTLFFSPVR